MSSQQRDELSVMQSVNFCCIFINFDDFSKNYKRPGKKYKAIHKPDEDDNNKNI
jgi:hypothetical protein